MRCGSKTTAHSGLKGGAYLLSSEGRCVNWSLSCRGHALPCSRAVHTSLRLEIAHHVRVDGRLADSKRTVVLFIHQVLPIEAALLLKAIKGCPASIETEAR